MATLAHPLRGNPPVSSPYGPRAGGFHTGVDFAVRTGTPVYAAAGGIARRSTNFGGGKGVVIDHGDGMSTEYWHLNAQAISGTMPVRAGQLIGYSGASGTRVTGPHLHFEVNIGGVHVDPARYLAGIGNPSQGWGDPAIAGARAGGAPPDVALGEITREAPPGTYPDVNGSGGGRCNVAEGWRDASALETFVRPELEGYCVRISPGSIAGEAIKVALELPPFEEAAAIALNIGVVAGAVLIGWGGVKRIIGG